MWPMAVRWRATKVLTSRLFGGPSGVSVPWQVPKAQPWNITWPPPRSTWLSTQELQKFPGGWTGSVVLIFGSVAVVNEKVVVAASGAPSKARKPTPSLSSGDQTVTV
jgi:hypothetical protein